MTDLPSFQPDNMYHLNKVAKLTADPNKSDLLFKKGINEKDNNTNQEPFSKQLLEQPAVAEVPLVCQLVVETATLHPAE